MNKKTVISLCLIALCFFNKPLFAQNIDIDWLKSINVDRNKSLDNTFKFISNSEAGIVLAAPLSMLAIGLVNKNKALQYKALELGTTIVVSTAIGYSLKRIVNRPRPSITYPFIENVSGEDISSFSFPSGHTSLAFAAATTLSMQYPKWYVIVPSFVWASAVGYSRMDLGVHYPSDVLAGAAIGAGSAILSKQLNKWLQKKKFLK